MDWTCKIDRALHVTCQEQRCSHMKEWFFILIWRITFGSRVWHNSHPECAPPVETGVGQSMRLKAAEGEGRQRGNASQRVPWQRQRWRSSLPHGSEPSICIRQCHFSKYKDDRNEYHKLYCKIDLLTKTSTSTGRIYQKQIRLTLSYEWSRS
jgi:hypothetical protein